MQVGRRIFLLFLLFILGSVALSGCAGSKKIVGTWKATDGAGNQYTLKLTKSDVTLVGNSQTENHAFKQTAIGTENGIRYYGLTVKDEQYSVIFPDKKNQDIALWVQVTGEDYLKGNLIFALNKQEQPDYATYVKKYFSAE